MFDVLHWLPLRHRIEFRVVVLVWYFLVGQASAYLTHLCTCSLRARSNRHFRSAEQGFLHVPFARTIAMQNRAFSVVGPLVWNGLPFALRSLPRVSSQKFLEQLKTTLFVTDPVLSNADGQIRKICEIIVRMLFLYHFNMDSSSNGLRHILMFMRPRLRRLFTSVLLTATHLLTRLLTKHQAHLAVPS